MCSGHKLLCLGSNSAGLTRVHVPCRGKLLNVRDASAAQIAANAEIQAIKQIMGLQHGKVCFQLCAHAPHLTISVSSALY